MKIVAYQDLKLHQWNEYCDASPAAWWWHRAEWIEYCEAYGGGQNLSFVVMLDEQLVGLCQLIKEGTQFSAGGDPLSWPFINHNLDSAWENTLKWEAARMIHTQLEEVALSVGASRALFRGSPLSQGQVPHDSYVWLYDVGFKDISWSSRVLDLRLDEGTLWRDLRASSHSLIHRAQERLDFHGGMKERWRFAEFERLHKSAHASRPQRTYECQAEWLSQDRGVVYTANARRSGMLVGAAYFNLYKQMAYYGSAAYLEPDVACALIWHAILDLKRMGIQCLEMGWQGHADDEKGRNVEFFKRGFGGQDVPLHVVEKRWSQ